MKGEIIHMDKPEIKTILPEHYLDYLKETYKPPKTAAGQDYLNNPLTYFTFEQGFLSTDNELDFICKYGFAPIGLLVSLRVNMSSGLGYGIKMGRPLNKVLNGISLDTDIPMTTLNEYYEQLLSAGFLIIIDDSEGNQVVTTLNQLYNWELKEYTKWCNAEKQRKSRKNKKNKAEEAPLPEEWLPSAEDVVELAVTEAEALEQLGYAFDSDSDGMEPTPFSNDEIFNF